jgi:hypothetical protein
VAEYTIFELEVACLTATRVRVCQVKAMIHDLHVLLEDLVLAIANSRCCGYGCHAAHASERARRAAWPATDERFLSGCTQKAWRLRTTCSRRSRSQGDAHGCSPFCFAVIKKRFYLPRTTSITSSWGSAVCSSVIVEVRRLLYTLSSCALVRPTSLCALLYLVMYSFKLEQSELNQPLE